jgi:phosphatidylinositol alpha-mannosyltransferase
VPSPLPDEGEREAILYVGRLEVRKDVLTLIRAAAMLGSDGPPVWIVGDGPLRATLEHEARQHGLANIRFFGEVSDEEKWRLLRRAALFVSPAIGGESFGIVLVEAMAAGAPPLAADNSGYRSVLADRATDLLFTPMHVDQLWKRMSDLLADRARLAELRAWGEREWHQYDWTVLAERVERVYAEAVADG